jgi:uncharacterized oxidoreductase
MKMTGNTILITGGGSGIGQALAEMFHARGNDLIIAGRNQEKLEEVTSANPGMQSATLDITDAESIEQFAAEITAKYPALNVVIHNAGIMKSEVIGEDDVSIAEKTIATNLLGPIRLNSALLPHLKQQAEGTIITVSSGLAFLPRFDHPTYCATKAALHSYTQSLRTQLKNTAIQVIELIPPYVQTELTGPHQASDPKAMPLSDYIHEVTTILENNPAGQEVAVERVQFQRQAESSGEYAGRYQQFQERFIAGQAE